MSTPSSTPDAVNAPPSSEPERRQVPPAATDPSLSERKPLALHLSVASGLLMGSADAIPGVSGGTIALIIGVYDRLIDSLSTVVKTPFLLGSAQKRRQLWGALRFLLPLMIGIGVALFAATRLLVGPANSPGLIRRPETAPICYAFFFGLVLFSLREPWMRMSRRGWPHYVAAVIAAAGAAVFVGLPYSTTAPETWMLVYGGALAITVMLLPGISGSMLLVILGQYGTVASALHDRNWLVLGVFLAGVVVGVITFIPILRYLLRKQHDLTMAALTGLMAGSLRALWPWKLNYDAKLGPMTNTGVGDQIHWVVLAAVAGACVVWLLAMLEKRILASER